MLLDKLTKEHLEVIVKSVKTNPNLKPCLIEEILSPIRHYLTHMHKEKHDT